MIAEPYGWFDVMALFFYDTLCRQKVNVPVTLIVVN